MRLSEMERALRATLDDSRLSRAERSAFRALVADEEPSLRDLEGYRHLAFDLARERIAGEANRQVVDWLEQVVKTLLPQISDAPVAEAYFSPRDECWERIHGALAAANRSVDVCVFTITDNRLSAALLDAKRRGLELRVITDDDKALDRGSDIKGLRHAGVDVRMDDSPDHMHHKFAVVDGRLLITGSYNWTRSASVRNQENVLLTGEPRLVERYVRTFEELWKQFAPRGSG